MNIKLERLAERLEAFGMGGVLGLFVRAARPLGPVGASALWMAQPALGLVMDRDTVGEWAELLEDPNALAWLSQRLAGEEVNDRDR